MKKIGMNRLAPTKITCSFTRPSGSTPLTASPARKAPTIFSTPASSAARAARNTASSTSTNSWLSLFTLRRTSGRPSRWISTSTRAA